MMRRKGVSVVLLLALLGFVGLLAPSAQAQQAGPKVTIKGYIDVRGSVTRNTSLFDGDYTITGNDHFWQHGTRGRLYIEGEMSPDLKGVFAFEYDVQFGQHQACTGSETVGCRGGRSFLEGSATLGNDVQGIDQLKWLYIDFKVPVVPVRVRTGLFPVGAAQLKVGNLLVSDVPGGDVTITFNDQVQMYLVATSFEEHFGGSTLAGHTSTPLNTFARGDDYAVLGNFRFTPVKGLTILPVVAFEKIAGTTTAFTRLPMVGMTATAAGGPNLTPDSESRWYFGVDLNWQIGSYYIAPTFIYMAGERTWRTKPSGNGGTACTTATCQDSDIRSFLADLRGGGQFGPLRLEGFFQYSPGNEARDVAASATSGGGFSGGGKTVRDFQNIWVDSGQNLGWSQLITLSNDLGDYFGQAAGINAGSVNTQNVLHPGYGPWGRILVAGKANYALTPSLSGRFVAGASWTAEEADTRCNINFLSCDGNGNAHYLGTELNLGAIYRIYPGLTVDGVFSYLFTGDAYGHNCSETTGGSGCDPKNAWAWSYKLAYSF